MLIERLLSGDRIPEALLRLGTRRVVRRRLAGERARKPSEREAFVDSLGYGSLAGDGRAANTQHYDQPAEFFAKCLGHRLKYSASIWPTGARSLDDAEDHTLELYAKRARVEDGQRTLDLGCGWGTLSLWLAARYPNSSITSVSDSRSQRDYITERAAALELGNLEVVTADVSELLPNEPYDRIVSIEMFEHLRNYRALFDRLASWIKDDGLVFVHVFAHREFAYPYEDDGQSDWMARRFFTGGIMPSRDLLPRYCEPLELREAWWESGRHYSRTAEAWLANLKAHRSELLALFAQREGSREALTRYAEWKLFFIACAELFGYADGREWGVGHYLFGHSQTVA